MGTGQLEVRPWQDSTLLGGCFDLEAWLTSFEQILRSGPEAGYGQTRFFGHMEWSLSGLPGTEDLMEYETRVNYVIPKYEDTVVCAYDLTKFGASAAMDALRTTRRDHRRTAPGKPVLRLSRPVAHRDPRAAAGE